MAAGFILTTGSLSAALSVNVTMLVIARIIIGIGTGNRDRSGSALSFGNGADPHPRRAHIAVSDHDCERYPCRIPGQLCAGAHRAWRIMLGVAAAPSFVMFVGMWLQPESPRWLCRRGLVAEARAVLLQRRPTEEVDREVADMQRASARPDAPLHRLLQDRRIRRGMIIATLLTVLNDLTGITAVNYYAPTIFRAAGLGAANAILISVGLQVMTVGCTVVASLIVDAVGRRTCCSAVLF